MNNVEQVIKVLRGEAYVIIDVGTRELTLHNFTGKISPKEFHRLIYEAYGDDVAQFFKDPTEIKNLPFKMVNVQWQ